MESILDIVAAYTIGLLGMIAHWAKRWKKGETFSSLLQYIYNDLFASIRAVLTMVAGVSVVLANGTDYHTMMGFAAILSAGYIADSTINTEEKP